MRKSIPIGDRIPGLVAGSVAIIMAGLVTVLVLADLFFAVGWLIRLLEITSAYDGWLPAWSAWDFLGAAVLAAVCTKLLIKAAHRFAGIPE